jgi:calcineurin-like phosphoesterase family protein
MNAKLLDNIASTVGPNDTLYVLGDTCFDMQKYCMYRAAVAELCHEVVWIKGNHDPKQDHSPLAVDFKWNRHHYYCCHYPWASFRPNTVMLHGHCHGNPAPLVDDPRQANRFDVGVDVWDYRPVSIEQIEALLS